MSSTINLYPEVSSPSSASLSSLLDVSPYANASAAAVNDRKSCSYNGCDNSNVRDQQVPSFSTIVVVTTTNDLLLLLPFIDGKTGWHFVGFITDCHSQLFPTDNLPLSPFPFPLSLS